MYPDLSGETAAASAPEATDERENQVLVSNLHATITESQIRDFFQFSGTIKDVALFMDTSGMQAATVTFSKKEEAETACMLTGALIGDEQILVSMANMQVPPVMSRQAVDVISKLLSKGYLFASSTLDKLNSFDQKHQISSKVKDQAKIARAKIEEFDAKYKISEKSKGFISQIETKINDADKKYGVSEKVQEQAKRLHESDIGKKVTDGFKFGFSTVSANVNKLTKATQEKLNQEKQPPK